MVAISTLLVATVALATSVDATPAPAKRANSAGCGKQHNIGYNTNGGKGFALGNRTYTVRVPPNYDPSRGYSLILDYHGHGGWSDDQFGVSQYDKFDTAGDFITVYPQGIKNSWEGPHYADPNVDDLGFTADLVQRMKDNYCVDTNRVYASGKSNGGGFVGTLACSPQGSLFAAFAMSSAALYTDNLGAGDTERPCKPSRANLPIIEVHGSADNVISYDGGKGSGGKLPAVPAWLSKWASRNGAVDKNVHFPSPTYGSRVNVTTWHVPGTSNINVQGVWVQGMGHCWASTEANRDWSSQGADVCRAPFNATTMFLKFFNNWDINGFRG